MTIQPKRFVRNPLYAEAIQVTAENMAEVAEWCKGEIETLSKPSKGHESDQFIRVHVFHPFNESQTKAFIGDWVSSSGTSFRKYSNKAFTNTFSLLDGEAQDKAIQDGKPSGVESFEELLTTAGDGT